jgi:hypothetical protein
MAKKEKRHIRISLDDKNEILESTLNNIDEKKEIHIYIDETGTPNKNINTDPNTGKKDAIFGMAATVTKEPEKFGLISKLVHIMSSANAAKGQELKASDAEWDDRKAVAQGITLTDSKTYGVYIEKETDTTPAWWNQSDRGGAHRKVLSELTDDVLSDTKEDDLIITIDDHAISYANNLGSRRVSLRAKKKGKTVEVSQGSSKTDQGLQTQDYVTWSMGRALRYGDKELLNKIEMKPRSLNNKRRRR